MKITEKGLCASHRGLQKATPDLRGQVQLSKKAQGLGADLGLCPGPSQHGLGIHRVTEFCFYSLLFVSPLPSLSSPIHSSPLELSIYFGERRRSMKGQVTGVFLFSETALVTDFDLWPLPLTQLHEALSIAVPAETHFCPEVSSL